MEQVRALDDDGLRRVVAELVGYRVVPCLEVSNAGLFRVVYGDQEAEWCGRSVAEAWGMSLMGVENRLNIPDYVRDLNAAVGLLAHKPLRIVKHIQPDDIWTVGVTDFLGTYSYEVTAPTLARALCLAYVALRLAEQETAS
jgi:hypothetical protein